MVGAVSPDSFDTLHSYSNTFQMPFVTPWFPEKVLTPSSGSLDYAISMRPEYHQAIIDTVKYYNWKKIVYLYDSNDGRCTKTGDVTNLVNILPTIFLGIARCRPLDRCVIKENLLL